ncbi:MAG: TMEM175 family protein [Lachnospiraceae bacterium]|nr:TMEM175 family protein [Lachnospiraceae bacterium]
MKKLFFDKDRLGAFMDAIIAIIMTILILELAQPAKPTLAAFLGLWRAFVSYAISFFWLASMWTALHMAWDRIERVSQRTVWISLFLLFWASFQPYMTKLMIRWNAERVVQGAYGLVIIITTLNLYWLYVSLNKDNAGTGACGYIAMAEKNLRIDLAIKIIGFVLGMLFYPQLVEIGVLIAAAYMIIGRISLKKKVKKHHKDMSVNEHSSQDPE